MSDILIFFGFIWMIVGALIGMYLGNKHEPHLRRLEEIATHGSLIDYHRSLEGYKRQVVIHAHSFLFPLVAIVVGIVMPRVALPEGGVVALGSALIAAAPTWTLGGLRSSKPLMALGDILLLGSIAATAYGIARGL